MRRLNAEVEYQKLESDLQMFRRLVAWLYRLATSYACGGVFDVGWMPALQAPGRQAALGWGD